MSPKSSVQDRLRKLPAVAQLLEHAHVARLLAERPRGEVVTAARAAIDAARVDVLAGAAAPSIEAVAAETEAELAKLTRPGMRRVINATGIVLHTGLGRAVLPKEAIDALVSEASGYCLLAMSDETNARARRERFCEDVLKELTGCEMATVVNNNAAAVLLTLNTLAAGREVIISRGQLVEIGGSYRMPDVMAAAGCRMVEVGCTNRTHLRDFEEAITEDTAAIIRVHPSNYRIQGFTSEVSLDDMCALGRKHDIPVIDDLGAGALVDIGGPLDEPLVTDSLSAGADVITCSSDKLIGGPQGGVILGRRDLVYRIERNQMSRALRVGKLDLIALEATLRLFRDRETLLRDHPTSRMLTETAEVVGRRAKRLRNALARAMPDLDIDVIPGESYAGSGALPIKAIPTIIVTVAPPADVSANEAARRLRVADPSLFVRVKDDRLILDPRTIQDDEQRLAVDAMSALFAA